MSVYPDLTDYGYKIDAELGRNRQGGRITWKGITLDTQKTVVIKQFCFASAGSNWSGYKAYEQEIKVLQRLEHTSIPKYLSSIETQDGFCLIQEYVSAQNLNNFRQLSPLEVKQIARKILDILVYLQQQQPPILHRDLKPENILLDESLNVYLIDFGFATFGSQEVSGSSVFKGTPGFMAPEQIIKPTTASDIYSLGITLVCLLTHKNITEIYASASADNPYQLALEPLLSQLDRPFVSWLEKMVAAKVSQRFPDAVAAKNALIELDLTPELPSISKPKTEGLKKLNSIATQTLTGTLAISGLSTVAVWGISRVMRHLELTPINIAIAILAAIVISVTQLGAAEIARSEAQARLQGIILALIVPSLLVCAGGLIWGQGEAVGICGAIAVAEIFVFSYFWWQIPYWQRFKFKAGFWFGAIALGVTLGLKLI
ncbi:serine/threonine protein kinase [Pleurocapsales cyanobacterium LEGE 10410]|nr:serine/threonine protein kinase [Pleurocapsales cyanobacterium LEGE 10410]